MDIECGLCFTNPSPDYYQPEWSDIPTCKIYSCRCGAMEWTEELTDEEEWEFMQQVMEGENETKI